MVARAAGTQTALERQSGQPVGADTTGGIQPGTFKPWLDAGADGAGLGSGLYVAGQSPAVTAEKARAFVAGLGR